MLHSLYEFLFQLTISLTNYLSSYPCLICSCKRPISAMLPSSLLSLPLFLNAATLSYVSIFPHDHYSRFLGISSSVPPENEKSQAREHSVQAVHHSVLPLSFLLTN